MKIAEDHSDNDSAMSSMEARRSTILGDRVKFYRTARRLTLRELGDIVGTTASFLSQLERGLSDLFDERKATPHAVLTRAERPALPVSEGYRKTLLSRRPIRDVEVYCGHFDVGGSTGDAPYTHGNAHEMFLVLRGRVELTLGGETFILDEGDSIEYPTSTPHKTVNVGSTPAEVLWIIAPPTSGTIDLDEYVARKPLAAGLPQAKGEFGKDE